MSPPATPSPAAASASPGEGSHGAALQMLRLSVAGETHAVPLEAVREILEFNRLTAVPRTPAFMRGVINLRGAVVPVVDLAARLGGTTAAVTRRSCIVVAEAGRAHGQAIVAGMLVDAVHEVMDFHHHQIEPVPSMGTHVPPRFLAGVTRMHGQIVGILDIERVLAVQELTEEVAAFAGATESPPVGH